MTEDGWMKTRDIATMGNPNPNLLTLRRLSIVDRKKNIFRLAQGDPLPLKS